MIAALLKEGFRPIIFCRFIATAEYVAAALRQDLSKEVAVVAVTSELPPTEREARISTRNHEDGLVVLAEALRVPEIAWH